MAGTLRNNPGQGKITTTRQELSDRIPSNYKIGPHARKFTKYGKINEDKILYLTPINSYFEDFFKERIEEKTGTKITVVHNNQDFQKSKSENNYKLFIIEPAINFSNENAKTDLEKFTKEMIEKGDIILIDSTQDKNMLKTVFHLKKNANYTEIINKNTDSLENSVSKTIKKYIK